MHIVVHMSNAPIELEALAFDMADRLRKSLRVADMGVQEIARDLDVSRNTVSGWLSGAREPRRAYVRAWAMATGVPYVWLETGEAPSPGGDGASDSSLRPESNRRPFYYE